MLVGDIPDAMPRYRMDEEMYKLGSVNPAVRCSQVSAKPPQRMPSQLKLKGENVMIVDPSFKPAE